MTLTIVLLAFTGWVFAAVATMILCEVSTKMGWWTAGNPPRVMHLFAWWIPLIVWILVMVENFFKKTGGRIDKIVDRIVVRIDKEGKSEL